MVDISTGAPEQLVVYPGNTRLPIVLAAVTGVFFLSLLLKFYWLTPLALIGVTALSCWWVWIRGTKNDVGGVPIGRDVSVPVTEETGRSPGWWGSVFLLVADGTLFGSLLFGYAFLWTIAPGWPPPVFIEVSIVVLGCAVAGLSLAGLGTAWALRSNRMGTDPSSGLLAGLAGTLFVVGAFVLLLADAPSPNSHAYGATLWVLGSYGLGHALIAGLVLGFLLARHRAGFMSRQRRSELAIAPLWIGYLTAITLLVMAATYVPSFAA